MSRTEKEKPTTPRPEKGKTLRKPDWEPVECPKCYGWGSVQHYDMVLTCEACEGEGVIYCD